MAKNAAMGMDMVDYEIFGDGMLYVQVELVPGEAAVGEAVAMMIDDGMQMDTILGDRLSSVKWLHEQAEARSLW